MSSVSSRAAVAAGVAVALGLTFTAAAIAVLAGSLGGQPPTNNTRPECPTPGSASPHHGPAAAWLPQASIEGDNQAEPDPTRAAPTDVDIPAIGCAPVLIDTNSGSEPAGTPARSNPGG